MLYKTLDNDIIIHDTHYSHIVVDRIYQLGCSLGTRTITKEGVEEENALLKNKLSQNNNYRISSNTVYRPSFSIHKTEEAITVSILQQ